MNNFLSKIVEQKIIEIAKLDVAVLRVEANSSPEPRDFLSFIQREAARHQVHLIAELKRASPSKGLLAAHLDLYEVADIYAQNGASAISVLTDEKFFLGQLETLKTLRYTQKSRLPLL